MSFKAFDLPPRLPLPAPSGQRPQKMAAGMDTTLRILKRAEAAIERSYELIRRSDDLLLNIPLTPHR